MKKSGSMMYKIEKLTIHLAKTNQQKQHKRKSIMYNKVAYIYICFHHLDI